MFKKINTQIENLFDQDSLLPNSSFENSEKVNIKLENNNNMLENLSYIFSDEINASNIKNLFIQLSCYFEIGILLRKKTRLNDYHILNSFAFQRELSLVNSIRLPVTSPFHVLRTDASGILRHFGLIHLDIDKKMASYLIHLSNDYSLIVMTEIAEPWAGLKIEVLQKTLMKINFFL